MNISEAGVRFIASQEGLSLVAYQDSGGRWTIGYGHLCCEHEAREINAGEALEMLRHDACAVAEAITRVLPDWITQWQFDALCSLAYNIGVGAFRNSFLVRALTSCDECSIADCWMVWIDASGHVLPGLVRRRARELCQFLEDPIPQSNRVDAGGPKCGRAWLIRQLPNRKLPD